MLLKLLLRSFQTFTREALKASSEKLPKFHQISFQSFFQYGSKASSETLPKLVQEKYTRISFYSFLEHATHRLPPDAVPKLVREASKASSEKLPEKQRSFQRFFREASKPRQPVIV